MLGYYQTKVLQPMWNDICPSYQEGSLGLGPISANKANQFTNKERGSSALQQPHRSHHSDVRRHQLPFSKNKCPYGEGVLKYVVLFDTTGFITLLGLFDGSLPYLAPAPRTFQGSPLKVKDTRASVLCMQCYAVLRFAFCCAVLCFALLCCTLLCIAVLCCCCAHCAVPCYAVLCYTLRSGVVRYAALYCAVLCLVCCAAPCSIMNVTFGRDRSLGQVAVLLSEWYESFLRLDCGNFRVITNGET